MYLETDPVQLQIELHEERQYALDFLEPHVAFFTFGENYGQPGCGLPVSERFPFHPDAPARRHRLLARRRRGLGRCYTTVGNWSQPWRDVTYDGERYGWSKDEEFRKVLALPSLTGRDFELALAQLHAAGPRAAREPRLACTPGARLLHRPRRLPRVHPRLARRVHGREGPERPASDRLVQRPQRHVPRRRPPGGHPGHRASVTCCRRARRCSRSRRSTRPPPRSRRSRRTIRRHARLPSTSPANTSTPRSFSVGFSTTVGVSLPVRRRASSGGLPMTVDLTPVSRRPTAWRPHSRGRRSAVPIPETCGDQLAGVTTTPRS